MRDALELLADRGVDRRVGVAVDVAPQRRGAVEVGVAVGVVERAALGPLDDQRVLLAPALLLRERVPQDPLVDVLRARAWSCSRTLGTRPDEPARAVALRAATAAGASAGGARTGPQPLGERALVLGDGPLAERHDLPRRCRRAARVRCARAPALPRPRQRRTACESGPAPAPRRSPSCAASGRARRARSARTARPSPRLRPRAGSRPSPSSEPRLDDERARAGHSAPAAFSSSLSSSSAQSTVSPCSARASRMSARLFAVVSGSHGSRTTRARPARAANASACRAR